MQSLLIESCLGLACSEAAWELLALHAWLVRFPKETVFIEVFLINQFQRLALDLRVLSLDRLAKQGNRG